MALDNAAIACWSQVASSRAATPRAVSEHSARFNRLVGDFLAEADAS